MVSTSTPSRAVTELVVRIKMVIIIVTTSKVILVLLLLSATKEESLLRPGCVQKVIALSSCSWMTNIFTKDRWED